MLRKPLRKTHQCSNIFYVTLAYYLFFILFFCKKRLVFKALMMLLELHLRASVLVYDN